MKNKILLIKFLLLLSVSFYLQAESYDNLLQKHKELDLINFIDITNSNCSQDNFVFKKQRYFLSLCDHSKQEQNLEIKSLNYDFEFSTYTKNRLNNYENNKKYDITVTATDDAIFMFLEEEDDFQKDYKTYLFKSIDLHNWEKIELPAGWTPIELQYASNVLFLSYKIKSSGIYSNKYKLAYLDKENNIWKEYILPIDNNGKEVAAFEIKLVDNKIFIHNDEYNSHTGKSEIMLYFKPIDPNNCLNWQKTLLPQTINSVYNNQEIELKISDLYIIDKYGDYLIADADYYKSLKLPGGEGLSIYKSYYIVSNDHGYSWHIVNFDFNANELHLYEYNGVYHILATSDNKTLNEPNIIDKTIYINNMFKNTQTKYYQLSKEQLFSKDKLDLKPIWVRDNTTAVLHKYFIDNTYWAFGLASLKNDKSIVEFYK